MANSIKKAFKNSSIYLAFSLAQKGAAFLLLPVYTAMLSPEEYGTVGTILAFVEVVIPFASFSLSSAAMRMTYANKLQSNPREAWGTLLLGTIGISSFFCLIFLATIDQWSPFIFTGIPKAPFVLLGIVLVLVHSIFNMIQAYWRAVQVPQKVGVNNLLLFLLTVSLNLVFLFCLRMHGESLLWASVIAYVLATLQGLIGLKGRITLTFRWSTFFAGVKYAFPIIPHLMLGWVLKASDRYLIFLFIGEQSVGLYLAVSQIASMVGLVSTSIMQSFTPWYMEGQSIESGNSQKTNNFSIASLVLLSGIVIFLSLFSKELFQFVLHEKYNVAWIYLPGMAFAFLFQTAHAFFITPVTVDNPGRILISTLLAGPVSIALNLLLLPLLGLWAPVIASIVSMATMSLVSMIQCHSFKRQIYPWFVMYGIILGAGAISASNYLFSGELLPVISIKLAILIILATVALLVLTRKNPELAIQIAASLKKWKGQK
ncbi:conserved membrane hypothetical protein [Gammaproteobacteria bacterium]